ncbi:hypothetical protein QFZ94_008288 [Paraburkholderia sp. JPY465]
MLALVNEILVKKGMMLKTGTVVVATLIPAPSSTKNSSGTRDPEMRQTQKSDNRRFGVRGGFRLIEGAVAQHVKLAPGSTY